MADNVTIPASGTGTATPVVATDDVLGAHYQKIKIAVGTADNATLIGQVDDAAFTPATDGVLPIAAEFDDTTPDSVDEGDAGALRMSARRELYTQIRDAAGNERGVAVTSANALKVDGSAVTQPVAGYTVIKDVTLSLDTSAYAAGDVHADSQQVDAALRVADGTGTIVSLTLNDKDDQAAAGLDVYFFSANVSLGTENAAPSISDANADNLLGIVRVAASDWIDLGGCKVASIRNIGIIIKAVSGTDDIYVATVTQGTPTQTASGMTMRIGILQD